MYLSDLAAGLQSFPILCTLSILDISLFIRICTLAKTAIQISQKDVRAAPTCLPTNIVRVLAEVTSFTDDPQLNLELIEACWCVFKDAFWMQTGLSSPYREDIETYNKAALRESLSFPYLIPPTRVCQDLSCTNHRTDDNIMTLTEPVIHRATLFTLQNGALPVYTTSLYCRHCHRRYYSNYDVHKLSSTRTYYPGVSEVIQVSQNYFLESSLLEFFATCMVFGWLSSSNCARIYNHALAVSNPHRFHNPLVYLATHQSDPPEWQYSLQLRAEDVLNGFFLYSILIDSAERGTRLVLEHDVANQRLRLEPMLHQRNKAMEGTGQECYTHACELCFLVDVNEQGVQTKIQPAICDGITIGHPCCGVHDCKISLESNRDRFCHMHYELNYICAVENCSAMNVPGRRTCADPAHRALENKYFAFGEAMFQLQGRLRKAGVGLADSVALSSDLAVPDSRDDDDEITHDVVQCDGKPDTGNRKLKARFGRRRTHNEQLFMRPCGIILSRATFYGSEAISAVNDFAKATFPSPESTPEYWAFDNNCRLLRHQRVIGETHFENTGMPVDVFHFNSKHKDTDDVCNENCNPAAFPELMKDGKWVFNTSICEQSNVWIGGFHAILQNMEATRFNFFADEMIKRRNRYVLSELKRKGKAPFVIPWSSIFPEHV